MSDADLDSMAELKDPYRLVKVMLDCALGPETAQERSTSS